MSENGNMGQELLAGYVCDEISAEERAAVEAWCAADPKNAKELADMQAAWEAASSASQEQFDVDGAWEKLSRRIATDEVQGIVTPSPSVIPIWKWVAAAAVLAGVVFGVKWLIGDRAGTFTTGQQFAEHVLTDATRIVLSPNSTTKARVGKERRIELSGEAYFEVARDEQRPFIVSVDELTVTVLGTAFKVSAYEDASVIGVSVKHGRVRVTAEGHTVDLGAGEKVEFDRNTGSLSQKYVPVIERMGNRTLQFQAAPMSQVLEELEEIYQVSIDMGTAAQQKCMLTATFDDEPIQQVLQVIADTYGFELQKTRAGSFMLRGDGC